VLEFSELSCQKYWI